MKRVVLFAAALLTLSGTAYSAVNPAVPTPSAASVVTKCEEVASAQKGSENPHAGQCIGATEDFIAALKRAGITAIDLDQQLIDLVTRLAPLAANDESCNAFDDEVARAIKLASDNIVGTDDLAVARRAQLAEISATVASCDKGVTNALPGSVSPSV
jgi:hypothetical protein